MNDISIEAESMTDEELAHYLESIFSKRKKEENDTDNDKKNNNESCPF